MKVDKFQCVNPSWEDLPEPQVIQTLTIGWCPPGGHGLPWVFRGSGIRRPTGESFLSSYSPQTKLG